MATKKFLLYLALGSMLTGCASLDLLPRSKPLDAYTRGLHHYREGHYKSAVKELETVPLDHPRYHKAQTYLAKANQYVTKATLHINAALKHRKAGELFKAKKEFEKALAVYPKHRRAQIMLETLDLDIEATMSFYYEKGLEEAGQKNYEEARLAFLEASKADPEAELVRMELLKIEDILVNRYLEEGVSSFEKGAFDEAIRYLEKAYEIRPDDPHLIRHITDVYNRRALKHYREEQLVLAIEDLKRSLEIDPEQHDVRNQFQLIQKRMGLLEQIKP